MDAFVFAAVLFAAACHAGWNATIKRGLDPLATTVLISIGAAIVAAALLPFVGLPAAAAWPWCVASVLIHLSISRPDRELPRRRHGAGLSDRARLGAADDRDARPRCSSASGSASLGWCGIMLLAAGVLLLSLRGGRDLARASTARRSVSRLFTAVTICAYSVVDGIGARAAGSANAYSVALFVGIGAGRCWSIALVPTRARGRCRRCGSTGASASPAARLQLGSYGIAIWAMTVAPIAIVAALRETSVLFGAVIAVVFLKEPLRASRIVAALMIVAGLALDPAVD